MRRRPVPFIIPCAAPALVRIARMGRMVRIRLFLACLLLLALPLQGALGASMRLCLPANLPSAAAPAVAVPAISAHAEHRHAADAHASHLGAASGDSAGASASTDLPGSAHQCDICEACGHAAALSASPASMARSPLVQSHPDPAPARIDTRGLPVPDKPPRA